MSRFTSNNSILAFLAGLFVGRRQRRRSGLSILILLAGLFSCCAGIVGSTVVVYSSWVEARQTRALPRPTPAELRDLSPGTRVLVTARLSTDAPTGSSGLALFYVERYEPRDTQTPSGSTPSPSCSQWKMEEPPPPRIEMGLEDETWVTIQLPPETTFLNSQTIDLADLGDGESPRRHVGYLPGQALTIKGTWEGDGLLTAQDLYAGSVDDYVGFLSARPGQSFLAGIMCGGIGIGLLLLGVLMRIFGK